VRDRLTPGGVVVVNVGHPQNNHDLEKVIAATRGSVFPHVARDPSEATNTIVVAGRRALRSSLLRPALRGGQVYTDDRAPVEWLIDRSLVEYAAGK
jgi:spermidine synthase